MTQCTFDFLVRVIHQQTTLNLNRYIISTMDKNENKSVGFYSMLYTGGIKSVDINKLYP